MEFDASSDAGDTPAASSGVNDPSKAPSRAISTDPDAGLLADTPAVDQSEAPTPAGSASGADDDEPASVYDDELDPINSGAQTPAAALQQANTAASTSAGAQTSAAVRRSKALNFLKKKDKKDIKGHSYAIVDDEIQIEDDPRGELKVDSNGELLGGREWRLRTFTSMWRKNPNKLYMLSIDVARAAGFRDSLYFFRKFPLVHKITVQSQEKEGLISQGKLPTMLRSRAVTFVSARNVFKILGAIFVKNGKYVFDDYYEDKSLAAGHQPGEPAIVEPFDPGHNEAAKAAMLAEGPAAAAGKARIPGSASGPGDLLEGRTATLFGGTGAAPFAKAWDPVAKKARPPAHLTTENWMLEYAKSAQEYNKYLASLRSLHVVPIHLNVGLDESDDEQTAELPPDLAVESSHAMQQDVKPQLSIKLGGYDGASSEARSSHPARNPFASSAAAYLGGNGPPPQSSTTVRLGGSAAQAPPAKRKRVEEPVKGYYESETNIAFVPANMQPTSCIKQKVDQRPRVFARPPKEDDGETPEGKRRRHLEEAAESAGVATVDVVIDPAIRRDRNELVDGIWDFEAGPARLEEQRHV